MFVNDQSQNPLRMKDFFVMKNLGGGGFGKVFLVRHKMSNDNLIAMKRMKFDYRNAIQIRRECEIHFLLNHPNIVRMFGHMRKNGHVYIFQEYVNGRDLFALLERSGKLSEMKVSRIISQVSRALFYLHSRGIIHRDLKLENILLDKNEEHVKLCDFGSSVRLRNTGDRRKSTIGTSDYFSPQIIQEEEYSCCVDMWALGVLSFELLVGESPFYNEERFESRRRAREGVLTFPEFLSPQAIDFIKRLLTVDSKKRWNASQILNHPFLTRYF